MKKAIIALGSNLQNPAHQVIAALEMLDQHPQITVEKKSSLYLTKPVGYDEQPDFINAVCLLVTSLNCYELLSVLNEIEAIFGRERTFRNAPRTLDLDIISYEGICSDDPILTLPHPRAHERGFVMWPLAEILPNFILGSHGMAIEIANCLGKEGICVFKEVVNKMEKLTLLDAKTRYDK